jgi:hypothetical protein
MQGGKLVGGTVLAVNDPSTYCAMANAGYDFTDRDAAPFGVDAVACAWLPKRQSGPRRAHCLRTSRNHAPWIPARSARRLTVDTVEEARKRALGLFPADGCAVRRRCRLRSECGVMFRHNATRFTDNLVVIVMIETLKA